MRPDDTPTLSEDARVYADTAVRTEDGTILPPTVTPNTGDRVLLEGLPRLGPKDSSPSLNLGITIGEGGMGIVRVAEQVAVGRQVAVKTLRPDRTEPELVMHLLREAWITGGLEHPNIIPVHDVGLDAQGRPMIVMKRVEGTEWSELIAGDEHDLRWHLRILVQVCNAIDFAGSRGIIHRDLKPANVMIGPFGEVYVLDWGIAVSIDDDGSGRLPLVRDVRGIAGTPGYMAPEMVRDTGADLSVRTDVYLLGAILHELITKKRRHAGGSLQAVLLASMESAPVEYEAYIPAELSDIANRATHQDPHSRFGTAGELRAAIQQFLEHESSRELTEGAFARLKTWAELEADDESPDPVAVQNLFGEARFGFEQALRGWPANEAARRGLEACLERKFEHDLARDDFESAAVVVAALAERRPDLQARLETLRTRIAKRRAELTELRGLQKARNLDIGRRTRAFLMLVTGLSFGLIPPGALLARELGIADDYTYFYATSILKLVTALGLVIWARESLTKTQVNRQLTAVLFLLMVMELAIRPFAQSLQHPIEHSLLIDFGLYALVLATLAITIDRRLAWCPLFYIVAIGAATQHLPWVFYLLGAAHFLSSTFTALVWRPDTLLRTPEELAAQRR